MARNIIISNTVFIVDKNQLSKQPNNQYDYCYLGCLEGRKICTMSYLSRTCSGLMSIEVVTYDIILHVVLMNYI